MLDLEAFIKNPPVLHKPDGEHLIQWGFSESMIRWLDAHMRGLVVETGCGLSTITMLANKCTVYTVDLDASLFDRVSDYCRAHEIDMASLWMATAGKSEHLLPDLLERRGPEFFDGAIIDGAHGLPGCMIDLHFIAQLLKIGGKMVVDDVQNIWQCAFMNSWVETCGKFKRLDRVGRGWAWEKTATIDWTKYDFDSQPKVKWEFLK